jgi:rod shape-determining protein MreC
MFDRARRLRLLLTVLVLASVTIVTIDFRTRGDGPLDAVGRVALTVLGPVQEGLAAITRPIGDFFAGFTKVPSLRARVRALEGQNAMLTAEREQIQDITRENASLRRLLVLRDRRDLRTMTAQVIGVSPSNFERTVFIDRGSEDGVRADMPVIAGEGLVGRVFSVGPSTATVLLSIDRSSAVAGRIASSGETGVLEGSGSQTLRFELLDPEAKVVVGDRIVTSGYDNGLFPPGIPVGTVTKAPPAGSHLTRVVTVQPLVDFSSLDYVLLVLGARETRKGRAR